MGVNTSFSTQYSGIKSTIAKKLDVEKIKENIKQKEIEKNSDILQNKPLIVEDHYNDNIKNKKLKLPAMGALRERKNNNG